MSDALTWTRAVVERYRPLAFFATDVEHPPVTGGEPGFAQVAIGLPRSAWGRLDPAAVARQILAHRATEWPNETGPRAVWGHPEDDAPYHAEVRVLEYDTERLTRFDIECASPGNGAYADLVQAFARVSRRNLMLGTVEEDWEDETAPAVVTALANGVSRRLEFHSEGDYVDMALVPKMNELLGTAPVRFHGVRTGDQTMVAVALTPEEHRRVHAMGWRFEGEDPIGPAAPAEPPKRPGLVDRLLGRG